MAKRNYDVLLKILLIGDSGVGKTSVLQRFCCGDFNDSFISTIGIDFKVTTLELSGKVVKLQIWDTAGQERFHTITASYYRGANGVVLLYDVTNGKSFENISKWLTMIEKHAPPRIVKMILGNKIDMADKLEVTNRQGAELAERICIPFFETSARDGTNVSKAFHTIAQNALDSYLNQQSQSSRNQPAPGSVVNVNREDIRNGSNILNCVPSKGTRLAELSYCGCV